MGKEPRMARIQWTLLAVLASALLAPVQGADETPNDTWKVTVHLRGQPQPLWLIKLQNRDGKWTGEVVASNDEVPKTTLSELKVTDGFMRFTLTFGDTALQFEGKAPAGAKKFNGTFKQGAAIVPVDLELTTLASLNNFDLAKDALAKSTNSLEMIDIATTLLRQAQKE